MKKILFFLIILLEMQCLGNAYARLVSIAYDSNATKAAGQVPFSVTIQSSDKDGQVTLKKDNTHPNIQNVVFNLNDLAAFSFTIPWAGWDGEAQVTIKVMKGNKEIARMDLKDRDHMIKAIGIKNAQTQNITKMRTHRTCGTSCTGDGCSVCSYSDVECSKNVVLTVDSSTGYISVPHTDFVDCPADDPDPYAGFND